MCTSNTAWFCMNNLVPQIHLIITAPSYIRSFQRCSSVFHLLPIVLGHIPYFPLWNCDSTTNQLPCLQSIRQFDFIANSWLARPSTSTYLRVLGFRCDRSKWQNLPVKLRKLWNIAICSWFCQCQWWFSIVMAVMGQFTRGYHPYGQYKHSSW